MKKLLFYIAILSISYFSISKVSAQVADITIVSPTPSGGIAYLCLGDSAFFENNSFYIIPTDWQWDFGVNANPPSLNVEEPNMWIKWNSAGVKTVTLSFKDGGNTYFTTRTVVVYDTSEAASSIIPSSNNICAGEDVTLSVNGGKLGDNAEWKWSKNDCNSTPFASGNPIVVSPSNSTDYFVKAVGCVTTACASTTINVKSNSTAPLGIQASDTSICSGDNTVLSVIGGSLGSGGVWRWYEDNCGGSPHVFEGLNYDVYPTSTTTYYVRAEDDCDTTNCVSITINVLENSTAASVINASEDTVCKGLPVTLTVSDGNLGDGASWVWYKDNCGTNHVGVGDSIQITPLDSTRFFVRAEGGCNIVPTPCAFIDIRTKKASIQPESILVSKPSICPGDSAILSITTGILGESASWKWYEGACGVGIPIASDTTNIKVSPSINTTYYVRAEGSCDTTNCASTSISIHDLSSAPTVITPMEDSLCLGESTDLKVTDGLLSSTASWQWYKAYCGKENLGTSVGSGASISISPIESTTYYVRAEGLCDTTACADIEINVKAHSNAPTGVLSGKSMICPGESTWVKLQGGYLGTNAQWVWYEESCDGTLVSSNLDSISVSPDTTTTYYVRAEGDCDTTACSSITIEVATPSIAPDSIYASQNIICKGETDTLVIAGGSLGTNGVWKWSANVCGGEVINTFINDSSIVISPETFTQYYLRYEDICDTSSCDLIEIDVLPIPEPTSPFIYGPNRVCQGDEDVSFHTKPFLNADTVIWEMPSSTFEIDTTYGDTNVIINFDVAAKSGIINAFGVNGCDSSLVLSLEIIVDTIANNPYFEFPNNDTIFYENDLPIIVDSVYPVGGVFSGMGMISYNQTFYPAIAGVGTHPINYEFTTQAGCTTDYTKSIFVRKADAYFEGLDDAYCYYSTDDSIIARPAESSIVDTASISYIIDETKNWGLGLGDTSGFVAFYSPENIKQLYPNTNAVITDTVVFKYYDLSTTDTVTIKEAIKIDVFKDAAIEDLPDQICEQDTVIDLIGTPSGGIFTGVGVVSLSNKYNPQLAANNNVYSDTVEYIYSSNQIQGLTCRDTATQVVTIHELTPLSIDYETFGVGDSICENNGTVQVVGVPSGGYFQSFNILIDPEGYFTPQASYLGGFNQFTYHYQDANQCKNEVIGQFYVLPTPAISIQGLDFDYCKNYDTAHILGLVDTGEVVLSNSGYFWLTDGEEIINQAIYEESLTDGFAVFYPDSTFMYGGESSFTLHYAMTAENGCTDTINQITKVYDLPYVKLDDAAEYYCDDNSSSNIISLDYSINTTGTGYFTFNGDSLDFESNFEISMDTINTGHYNVVYTYKENQTSCINSDTTSFEIRPAPFPRMEVKNNNYCIQDSIQFYGEVDIENSVFNDTIATWYWDFNDGGTSELRNPLHYFSSAEDQQIELTVTTTGGCTNSTDSLMEFDTIPPVSFEWKYECADISSTEFFVTSESTGPGFKYTWDFGDGNTSMGNDSVTHTYASPGDYEVSLKIKTSLNCEDTENKTIHIRPYLNSLPYLETFEQNSGGWFPDRPDSAIQINSWEHGYDIESGNVNKIIATNLDGDYEKNEYSAITSPCFDLRGMLKPIIKFKMKYESADVPDGMFLEASIDKGLTYFPIGDLNSGINWYNQAGIGENKGWAGAMNNSQWFEVKHKLDVVRNKPWVRFRFVFNSNDNDQDKGAYIDSIFIGERSRMVLMEHFTNYNASNSLDERTNFDNLATSKALDAVDIQYHTSFPGSDVFYTRYPAGPNARSSYYTVTDIPYTILDGIEYIESLQATIEEGDDPYILDRLALVDPKFHLGIDKNVSGGNINVNLLVQAEENIPQSNLSVYVALVEKEANYAQETYRSVLRRMLPGPSGTYFSKSWVQGETETLNLSGSIDTFDDPEQLRVVAFIQNIETKEVYQAATSDTAYDPSNVKQLVFSNTDKQSFILYPNPANDFINVLFNLETKGNLNYIVYNNFGSIIENSWIENGIMRKKIELNKYKPGMYFIKVFNKNELVGTSKFVIN